MRGLICYLTNTENILIEAFSAERKKENYELSFYVCISS